MERSPDVVENLKALRDQIPHLAKDCLTIIKRRRRQHERLEKWREQQLVSFLKGIIRTVTDLRYAYERHRISTVAWLTRNLLELSVWIQYCNLSDENAKRFHDDAVRDAYGLWKAIESLPVLEAKHAKHFLAGLARDAFDPSQAIKEIAEINQDFPVVQELSLDSIQQQFSMLAQAIGEAKLSDNYTKISHAAQEIGRGDLFQKQNRILSKFAHPTALILLSTSYQHDFGLDIFLDDAVRMAMEGVASIIQFTAKTLPNSVH